MTVKKIIYWVARDKNEMLKKFESRPVRDYKGYWIYNDRPLAPEMIDLHEFPDITWETEPRRIVTYKIIHVKDDYRKTKGILVS